jgi:hypothetical protein
VAKNHKLPIELAWQNWIMCLKGEDKNSIFNQITLMLWDTAIFHVILESQKEKLSKNPQAPRINKQLYSFIYRNYFHTQSAYIRRLTDASYGITGKKGVYSLDSIIRDVKQHRDELTREKYLELRSLSYDYSKIREKEIEFILNQPPGKKFVLVPHEFDWEPIKAAHETFDRLSHTTMDNQKASDLIDKCILDRLQNKLEDCRKINQYVDKFIAHAATIESRAIINIDEYNPTLNDIWNAHKIIYKVANFLSGILFSIDSMPLAIENPSFYDFWNEPFFDDEEAFDKVRTILEDYREETEIWMESSVKDVWSWIES